MANKNKVSVTVRGKGNRSVIVGGRIGGASSSNTENEVRANIDGEELSTVVAGGDIVEPALLSLKELLTSSLENRNEKEDLSDIIRQLNEQVKKSKEERNESKIKRLLNGLASYVSLASLAVAQAEKVKVLYERVAGFFGM